MNRKEAIQHIIRYFNEVKKPPKQRDEEVCFQSILKACNCYADQIQEVINPMTDIEIPFIRAVLLLVAEKILCVDESARGPADALYQVLMSETATIRVPVKNKE